MEDVLQVRFPVCAVVAAYWNTRKTVEHFQRMALQRLKVLAGSAYCSMNGFAKFGKVPTGIEPIRRHGCITMA